MAAIRSSLSQFRVFTPSIETKLGLFRVGTGSRCSVVVVTPARGLLIDQSRFFSNSLKNHQRQRFNLPSNATKKNYEKNGSYHNRSRRHHQQQIPNYVYFMGGVPVLGGLYLYFRFQDLAPLTGRRRWLATDPNYEKRMGDENYRQLLVQYKNRILPHDHPATTKIRRVGKRIFTVAGKFAEQNGLEPAFDKRKVTFTVVHSEDANAFVLPGNHVFFLTGMFKYAKTEDEIGCILGHEMAHNLARHQGEKMSSSIVVSLIAYLSLLVDPSGSILTVFVPAAKLLSDLPNSRHQESEADRIGMHLAAGACYDPKALSRVFSRMHTAGTKGKDKNLANKPPEFLSTHPSDTSRIKDMQKWLQEDKKILNTYDRELCNAFRRELQNNAHGSDFRQSNQLSC